MTLDFQHEVVVRSKLETAHAQWKIAKIDQKAESDG